jgi:hypothetical protein
MHIIVGLFEVNKTIGQLVVIQLQVLLDIFGILHQVIAFVKYEGTNLCVMAAALHSIIHCALKILRVSEGTCFGHVMSKVYQYATNDFFFFVGLKNVNVKELQSGLQQTITHY